MRETVERPDAVVDINALPYRDIDLQPSRLRVGSLVRMSELAAHPGVRGQFPVIAQALELSASAQIRNMASIGGNLMQRPRCLYFRDVSAACNRRTPGPAARRSEAATVPTRSSAPATPVSPRTRRIWRWRWSRSMRRSSRATATGSAGFAVSDFFRSRGAHLTRSTI